MATDEKIKRDVVDQLYWDSRVDASNVKVEVNDGKVKLDGEVPSFRAMESASEDAYLMEGVRFVDNDLAIRFAETVPSDKDIEDDIKVTLAWDADIDSGKIDVSVDNGIATLKGTVDAYWKKYQAEQDVSYVLGVARVKNELAVVHTDKFSDEEIAKEITNAMDRNAYVDAGKVDITVNNGKVDVSGEVSDWIERNEILDAARFTPGVVEVDDRALLIA